MNMLVAAKLFTRVTSKSKVLGKCSNFSSVFLDFVAFDEKQALAKTLNTYAKCLDLERGVLCKPT